MVVGIRSLDMIVVIRNLDMIVVTRCLNMIVQIRSLNMIRVVEIRNLIIAHEAAIIGYLTENIDVRPSEQASNLNSQRLSRTTETSLTM